MRLCGCCLHLTGFKDVAFTCCVSAATCCGVILCAVSLLIPFWSRTVRGDLSGRDLPSAFSHLSCFAGHQKDNVGDE